MREDPPCTQKRKRTSPEPADAAEVLDWGWLYYTIQEATESMFDALLNIVTREGYDEPSKHSPHLIAKLKLDPKSWCRKATERHTDTDVEIDQVIRECARTIQSLSMARATWSSHPSWVSILARWLRICIDSRGPNNHTILIFQLDSP
jgi:hypothetical protein